MKIEETLVIMSLLGAMSHSTKLLKVPRIYNALITSDENLQPSQAYPALAPVVHGIHYPLPTYVSSDFHQMVVVPNQVQYSDSRSYSYSVHNSVKEDYYHYNIVETGRPFKFDIPKIPSDDEKHLAQPAFFRPVVPVHSGNARPITDKAVPVSSLVDNNRMVYFQSSPAQQDDNQRDSRPPTQNRNNYGIQLQNPSYSKGTNPVGTGVNADTSTVPATNNNESIPSSVDDEKTESRLDIPEIDDLVKNNRPKDTNIVDIPPPPVPVGRNSNKKPDTKHVEYPPSPLGFI